MQQLFYNGSILTMDAPLRVEAVLTENGRILFAGSLAEAETRLRPDATRIDLAGKAMLPAFLDAHSHFSAAANARLQAPLETCTSFSDIQAAITRFIAGRPLQPGQWIMAAGYDHNSLTEQRHPPLSLLDQIAPDRPLVLQHKSGHVGVFNSAALSALGVTPATRAPAGGLIGRENGHLTGYMEENAFLNYLQQIPMPSAEDLLLAYQDAQEQYASYGISTVQEGMLTTGLLPLYRALLQSGILKLDLVGYADAGDADMIFDIFSDYSGAYNRHFRLGGCKIFLDGSPQSRTAWLRTPYAGASTYCGYGTMSDAAVTDALRQAVRHGRQLLAHCNGDAACRQYLAAGETVQEETGRLPDIRPVMVHAQLLGQDQLAQVRQLGMIPSFFTAHTYHWGDVHIRNFGMARAAAISPARAALATGIRFTFHQDSPVIAPNMLETVWCAVNRKTKAGTVLDGEQIGVLDALRAITINAAYQYFEEGEKGSIAPGKSADFVILDADPCLVPPDDIRNIPVLATIKAGECIFRR